MVRSTKRCLRKIIGQAKLSYDELLTAVMEVEAIINSRPLSYLTPDDLDEPLTPSHLLTGRRVLSLPDNLSYQEETEDSDLSTRVKHLISTMNQFWRRWRHKYLMNCENTSGTATRTQTAAGDLVMVHNENQPRGFWKMAKVQSLIVGKDGKVRGATLRVSSGSGKSTVLQRPTALLYPLEINCHDAIARASSSEGESEVQNGERLDREVPAERVRETPERPRREAALQAVKRMKAWTTMLNDKPARPVDHSPVVNGGRMLWTEHLK